MMEKGRMSPRKGKREKKIRENRVLRARKISDTLEKQDRLKSVI
jgi:hypothetical protein